MNWKFWTWDWKFWTWENPKPETCCEEEHCSPEFHEKEVLEPYVFPDPALEFPVLMDGATEEVHENLSEMFEKVEIPEPAAPVQENPVLMEAVVRELGKGHEDVAPKKRSRAKKDPLVDAAAEKIHAIESAKVKDGAVFSYKDLEPPKKTAKKAAKKTAKKAAKKKK